MSDTFPTSDLTIPDRAEILALISERRDLALHRGDHRARACLERVAHNLSRGAGLAWALGELLVESLNHPGTVYTVDSQGCSCPNGGRSCWHACVRDLLLDMQQSAADTADAEAERSEEPPPAPPTPIVLTQTPSGLTLTRGADSYTAIGPHGLGVLIRRLATAPAAPGARAGR